MSLNDSGRTFTFYFVSYCIVIVLYDISIKLFLQKLRVIIGFCDNGANPRAKFSLRLSEDIADCE